MKQCSFEVKFLDKTYTSHYIKSTTDAKEAIRQLTNSAPLFGIDTETRALDKYKHIKDAALSPHLSRIRLLQIFNGKHSLIFDLDSIGDESIFIEFLETHNFIAHNAIFDLQFFNQMGVLGMKIGCTMIAAKLVFHAIYPNDAGVSVSLGNLVEKILNTKMLKKVQASDWSVQELTFEQVEYAAIDAISVYKLSEKLSVAIKKHGLERIYNLCKASQHPIAAMRLSGVKIDKIAHAKLIELWKNKLWENKKEVLALTKLDEITPQKLGKWLEANLDKDTLAMWTRTATKKLSTDANTLAEFSHLSIVAPFSAYQKLDKLTSSFGTTLLSQVNPETERLHPQYWICGARTGRLSCSDPNIQQIPRDKEVRAIFVAETDRVLICADYSQIELRIAAEVSQDSVMQNIYRNGLDLHSMTALTVTGKTIGTLTKEERQLGKALGLGLLYGLGAKKFAHYVKKNFGLEISQQKALDAVQSFYDTYPEFRKWQIVQSKEAEMTLKVTTPFGKVRRVDNVSYYGASLNHPIQGGAAEVMMCALVNLHKGLADYGMCRLIACVHDEVIVECHKDIVNQTKSVVEKAMVDAYLQVYPRGITANLVSIGVGNSWSEAK